MTGKISTMRGVPHAISSIQKKVGPPYKEVLVKYAGKKPALIAFVLTQ